MKAIFASLVFVSLFAQAKPMEVASVLVNLDIHEVAVKGEILKQSYHHPVTTFLVGIPVEIRRDNVCTEFVGTELVKPIGFKTPSVLLAKGATSPVNEACITLLPDPIHTLVTFPFDVLTGGFVPAHGDFHEFVTMGNKTFRVTLNVDTLEVTVATVQL